MCGLWIRGTKSWDPSTQNESIHVLTESPTYASNFERPDTPNSDWRRYGVVTLFLSPPLTLGPWVSCLELSGDLKIAYLALRSQDNWSRVGCVAISAYLRLMGFSGLVILGTPIANLLKPYRLPNHVPNAETVKCMGLETDSPSSDWFRTAFGQQYKGEERVSLWPLQSDSHTDVFGIKVGKQKRAPVKTATNRYCKLKLLSSWYLNCDF